MSHFSNIQAMVDLQDEYNYKALVDMIQQTDEYVLADEIAKVLIVLWAGYSIHERSRIKESLMRYATDETFDDDIEPDDEDD